MNNELGAYHLASRPDLYEPQRNNDFMFIVTDVDNLLRAGMSSDDANAYITNAADVLRYSVVTATIPTFRQEPITIRRGNSVMKAAGLPTFEQGSITINDYIGADGKSAIMAWQNLSYNVRTQTVGKLRDYKKTCYLVEYSPDHVSVVRTWKLIGCWVAGVSQDAFSAESGDKKTISANIEYDYAVMEMPDEE